MSYKKCARDHRWPWPWWPWPWWCKRWIGHEGSCALLRRPLMWFLEK